MPQPVAVARALFEAGLPLRKAHFAIDCLASRQSYAVSVVTDDLATLVVKLKTLGVLATEIRQPEIDVKHIRETQKLSQSDFAIRYCLDVKNIQNWEQGRYNIDKTTEILLAIIRDFPDIVDQILTVGSCSGARSSQEAK